MFFNRAKSEIDSELSNRSLTSIQGLLLLATREAGSGRNSIGWVYSGMAIRMALDLGLHLDCTSLSQVGYLSAEDYKVRNTTFWGCYLFDQGWSLYLGRQSVMRLADVTVNAPEYLEDEVAQQWFPVYSRRNLNLSRAPVPFYPHNTSTAILKLSGIMEEVIRTAYIPGRQDAHDMATKCRALVARLSLWQDSLPKPLHNSEKLRHPALIMLHTVGCALRIFLYRRFPDLQQSLCEERDQIIALLARYRDLYSLQMTTNLSVYITFTAAAACLEPVADQKSDEDLVLCIDFLKDISKSWTSATAICQGLESKISSGLANNLFDMDFFDGLFLP
jgi:hypothetical protein